MTLTVHPQMQQRSPEWYAARCGIVTASAIGKLLTPTLKVAANDTSRRYATTVAAERITGEVEESAITPDMWRGIEHEPFARDVYAGHYGEVTEVGFMVRAFDGYVIGYSPDGLVGDDGLIEIKCPRQHTHVATILDDAVPDAYMPQLQAALLVSGREWIDFVSFVAGMPLWTKRVTAEARWHDALLAAAAALETSVAEMTDAYATATAGLPVTQRLDMEITF